MEDAPALRERLLQVAIDLSVKGALAHPADLTEFLGMVSRLETFVIGGQPGTPTVSTPVVSPIVEVTPDASSD